MDQRTNEHHALQSAQEVDQGGGNVDIDINAEAAARALLSDVEKRLLELGDRVRVWDTPFLG